MTAAAWTAAELSTLKRLYPRSTTADVARRLSRTPKSVSAKALALGLAKSPEQRSASSSISGKAAAQAIGDMTALGSKGGRIGGAARAAALTAKRRKEIARAAIAARWAKAKNT